MRHFDDFRFPDGSKQPISGYSTSVRESIGEVVIWFQELNEQLSTAIEFLVLGGDIGQIVVAQLSFKAKVELLAALFKHEWPDSEYLGHLQELSGLCLQIEEKRNQVVHSKWQMSLEGSAMTRSKYTARGKQGLQRQLETLTRTQVEAIGLHC